MVHFGDTASFFSVVRVCSVKRKLIKIIRCGRNKEGMQNPWDKWAERSMRFGLGGEWAIYMIEAVGKSRPDVRGTGASSAEGRAAQGRQSRC